MKRKIVNIHEDKCNGCGLCVSACHEGAIQLVSGKAKLIHDMYCDGLGDCLPACPMDAIEIIEREAAEYSQEAVDQLLEVKKTAMPLDGSHECSCSGGGEKGQGHHGEHGHHGGHGERGHHGHGGGGCPGSQAMKIQREGAQPTVMSKDSAVLPTADPVQVFQASSSAGNATDHKGQEQVSELVNWPVQIKLVNTRADYFKGANLLIAADCTAFAYANFHRDFVKDRIVLIGCPKLDDNQFYAEKLAELFEINEIKSITVLRMEVPCCSGIVQSVKSAILKSQKIVPYNEVTIKLNGEIL